MCQTRGHDIFGISRLYETFLRSHTGRWSSHVRAGLKVTAGKIKFMEYNHLKNIIIVTKEGSALEKFGAFK